MQKAVRSLVKWQTAGHPSAPEWTQLTFCRKWSHRAFGLWALVSIVLALLLTGCAGVTSGGGNSTATPTATGPLSANPTSLAFGSVSIGSSSSKTVTLTNTSSTATLVITSLSVTGSGFSASGVSSSFSIAASKSVSLTVSFSPIAAGAASGSISVSDSTGVILTIPLSGTGVSSGTVQLSASPSSIGFGSVSVGSSTSVTVVLTNSGSSAASIGSASYTGAGFELSGPTTPLTLFSGGSTIFTVTFAPTSAGSVTGYIYFNDASGTTLLTVAMTGTGSSSSHSVDLSWDPSTSVVMGYRIYRGTVSGGPYTLLTGSAISSTSYSDATVAAGATYYYVVTSVDSSGAESSYSNEAAVTIPNP